ncbi:MAG: bestrophin family ion channel [Leptolyngbyaceae bacterium]|nr:bestrophin family ion channel [Leptolyngbyaceae bacterium]
MQFLQRDWFHLAFRLRGSVIPAILPRTIICGVVGLIVSILYVYDLPVSYPLNNFIPELVLSLLLVFRTNTAYERFWEGRKLWGGMVNSVRNLARQMWIIVLEREKRDRDYKIVMLRMLVAYAVAVKLHLRRSPPDAELQALLPTEQFRKLSATQNPPLEIAFWIGDYLQMQHQRDRLNVYQLNAMQQSLNELVNYLGGCERILKTPIPLAYAIHLKQLLFIYCITLPFQVVGTVGWWTGPLVALIGFTLFGIEEIGVEIEDPFGCDPNDLPLDKLCETLRQNIDELINLSPCTSAEAPIKTTIQFNSD